MTLQGYDIWSPIPHYGFLQVALQIAPVLNINLYIRALCSAIPHWKKKPQKILKK